MNRLRNPGLMLVAALLVNTSFAQEEKTVNVGGAPCILQRTSRHFR